jgi:RimJ/RimL family protein N-acetyltransferase
MYLQELTITDEIAYKQFFQQGLAEYPQFFRLTILDDKNEAYPTKDQSDSFTLVAKDDDGLWLGVISFKTEYDNRENLTHKGLLFRMYVARIAAGKGVGASLVDAVISRARKLPAIEQIDLTVVSDNERAIELYSRFGFVRYGLEPRSIKRGAGQYQDEAFMKLIL